MKNTKNQFVVSIVLAGLLSIIGIMDVSANDIVTNKNAVATSSCPVITKFLKIGEKNDKKEVINLQNFLKNNENIDVDVSGNFDTKTENAVKSFQKKYADTILSPWNATRASGIVYITTAKQINKIACSIPLSLNDSEFKIVSSYKSKPDVSIDNIEISTTTTVENISTGNTNTASVGNTRVASKFFDFFKGLFK